MAMFARLVGGLLFLSTCAVAASAQTEQRVALVIGNGAYVNAGELKNPVNDAKAMAAMLLRAGFDVTERENTTRRAMIEATRIFANKLSPGGIGLFFYAGHGVQARGANYLLPIDVTLSVEDDLRYEAFDVQDILNKLDDSRVRLSLVILDACRDNPFAKSFRSSARGLAQIDAPRGSVIAYATAPGKLAADGDGQNGIYTSELLKAMSEPQRRLQDVFEKVTDAVERRTGNAQTPWISSSFRGDFYFFGPTTVNILPSGTPSTSQPGISDEAQEQAAWTGVANSTTPGPLEAFLKAFPHGRFAEIARAKIDELRATKPQALVTVPPQPSVAAVPTARPQCSEESRFRSIEGNISTSITFVNQTARAIRTYWINYQGERQFYAEVNPGHSFNQQTYVTHPWVVTNGSKECLGIFLPDRTPRSVVIR